MAQLGRALRSGRRGRRFESCRIDWLKMGVFEKSGFSKTPICLRICLRILIIFKKLTFEKDYFKPFFYIILMNEVS